MAEVAGQIIGSVTFTNTEIAGFPRFLWHVGSGPPMDSVGADRDLYLDKTTGDVYLKENGTWA